MSLFSENMVPDEDDLELLSQRLQARTNKGPFGAVICGSTLLLLCFLFFLRNSHGFPTSSFTKRMNDDHATTTATLGSTPNVVSAVIVNKKHHDDDDDDDSYCNDGSYGKRTLKLAYERPMASLFALDNNNNNGYEAKYETSGVIVVNETGYAICDSSWNLYQFGLDLQPRAQQNVRWSRGTVPRQQQEDEKEESDYEDLAYWNNTFFVVRESIEHVDGTYHSIVEEIQLTADNIENEEKAQYTVQRQCSTAMEFEGDSKGFEGLLAVGDAAGGEVLLLGLCEGNHCSEKYKHDRGNGRIVIMKLSDNNDGECRWETVRTLDIPSSANFADYSAMALNENGNWLAITSQEDSQLWVGRLLGKDPESGLWYAGDIQFDQGIGQVFDFPKDNDCSTIYCNIEGIHWINDGTLLAASDKMKKKGKQDFRCREKDQSVHFFVLPKWRD